MVFASGFTWLGLIGPIGHDTLIPGVTDLTSVLAHTWLVCGGLILVAVLARMQLERAKARKGVERYLADDRLSLRTMFEIYATGAQSVMSDMLDKRDVKVFFPFIGSLFLYIFTCNIIGIIPGFAPPTDNVNTNVGMAVISFLVFMSVGLGRDPIGFLKHLWGPMFWVGPLLFVVEVQGLLFRPLTLSLRLTGNMFGDHTVFSVMSDLVPFFTWPFLGLAIFVSFMQAFIFSLLSTVYLAMSVPHHEEEGGHH